MIGTGAWLIWDPLAGGKKLNIPAPSTDALIVRTRWFGIILVSVGVLFFAFSFRAGADLPKVILCFAASLISLWGLVFVLLPDEMASRVSITLKNEVARTDFAAAYGGSLLGVGAFLAWCTGSGLLGPGLLAGMFVLFGFALIRIVTWLRLDRKWGQMTLVAFVVELPGALLCTLALLSL